MCKVRGIGKQNNLIRGISLGFRAFIFHLLLAPLIVLLVGTLNPAWGEPLATIRDNGDPSNRVDMVILGDGYTAPELAKYAGDVETAVNGFFAQQPFNEYQYYFNVHRVDLVSNESGADHPELGEYRDTALDATYNCAGIQRLICVNTSKANAVLFNSTSSNQRDIVLVIVNDSEYGGGSIAVASTHSSVVELVLHEIGHSFGNLADEYSYGSCDNSYEPSEPNATTQSSRALIKWNPGGGPPTGWIETGTPIPTNTTAPGIPGLYEGAKYCATGLYRPTYNSKMRSLGPPYEQINEEQLIKAIYGGTTFDYLSSIDAVDPVISTLNLFAGQSQPFEVNVLEPLSHPLNIEWYVDGQFQQAGDLYVMDTANFESGSHLVDVVVVDPNAKVRYDPAGYLRDQHSWNVQIRMPGDLNGDLIVNSGDIAVFAAEFGSSDCNGSCNADLNNDGDVDGKDLTDFGDLFKR